MTELFISNTYKLQTYHGHNNEICKYKKQKCGIKVDKFTTEVGGFKNNSVSEGGEKNPTHGFSVGFIFFPQKSQRTFFSFFFSSFQGFISVRLL